MRPHFAVGLPFRGGVLSLVQVLVRISLAAPCGLVPLIYNRNLAECKSLPDPAGARPGWFPGPEMQGIPAIGGRYFFACQGLRILAKNDSRLFLIGPMGAGKTTVGKCLAEALGLRFFDLDEVLSARAGADIPLIFELEGEAGFRRREAVLLDEYTRLGNTVLASGGGCVLDPENRKHLEERGLVVYLKTPVPLQLSRLQGDTERPLLQAPDRRKRLEALAAERDPLYESIAHLVIEGDDISPAATCDRVLSRLPDGLRADRTTGERS